MNDFYSMSSLEDTVFHKSLSLLNRHVVTFFETSVLKDDHILFHLQNSSNYDTKFGK